MNFLQLLDVAQKNQQKNDHTVKLLDEQVKAKRLRRIREIEAAKTYNQRPVPLAPNSRHEGGDVTAKKQIAPRVEVVDKKSASTESEVPLKRERISAGQNERKLATASKQERHLQIANNKCERKVSEKSPSQPKETLKDTKQPKPKLTFAEAMNLAKKNVEPVLPVKRPYEELQPCSLNSEYLQLEIGSKPSAKSSPSSYNRNASSHSHTKSDATSKADQHKLAIPNKISSQQTERKFETKSNPLNGSSNSRSKSATAGSGSVRRQNGVETSLSSVKLPKSDTNINSTRYGIAAQLRPCVMGVRENKPSNGTAVQTKKILTDNQAPPISRQKQSLHTSLQVGPTKSNLSGVKPLKNAPPPVLKSASAPPLKRPSYVISGAGIAAQLGTSKPEFSRNISDDDEYESDDSFIDNSEEVADVEYARIVRDVHRSLKFDPRKYASVNPYEDLRSMESKYRDIEKEERKSARLGQIEDAEELARDLERKKRKKMS